MAQPIKRIPPVKYVIMFPGRTGSTFLASHMASHPEIASRYEMLSRCPDSWLEQMAVMEELYTEPRFPIIGAVGFKCKLSQVAKRNEFRKLLVRHNVKVIYQIRRNKLKYIISILRARVLLEQQGRSNIMFDGQKPVGPVEIPVSVFTRATKRFNVIARLEDFIDKLSLPKMVTAYEDLVADEAGELSRIWDFLEVSQVPTQSSIRKNTPDDLRSVVKNLDEILEHHPEMAGYVDT